MWQIESDFLISDTGLTWILQQTESFILNNVVKKTYTLFWRFHWKKYAKQIFNKFIKRAVMNIRMKLYDSYPNLRKRRTSLSYALVLIMMMWADGVVMSILPFFQECQILTYRFQRLIDLKRLRLHRQHFSYVTAATIINSDDFVKLF